MFGTRSKINRHGMDRLASGSRAPRKRMADSEVHRMFPDRRRETFFTVCVLCTHRQGKRNHRGSSTQTGNMNKEEGNGYPRFFSSPPLIIIEILVYFEFSRRSVMFPRSPCFLLIFNIFENFLPPSGFSYIRYSSPFYR